MPVALLAPAFDLRCPQGNSEMPQGSLDCLLYTPAGHLQAVLPPAGHLQAALPPAGWTCRLRLEAV
jgi:hypothetical protein